MLKKLITILSDLVARKFTGCVEIHFSEGVVCRLDERRNRTKEVK
jgi:hypothetical protein